MNAEPPSAETPGTLFSLEAFENLARLLATNYVRHCRDEKAGSNPIILILGAGASATAQFPSWDTILKESLLDQLCKSLPGEFFLQELWDELSWEIGYPTGHDLKQELVDNKDARIEMICSVACKNFFGERKVREFMSNAFAADRWGVAGPPPVLVYELIAHLVKHGFIDHIITFNFDELLDTALENELGRDGFERIFSGHARKRDIPSGKPRLIKIHGTVSSPESMRFTFMDVSVLNETMRKHLRGVFGFDGGGGAPRPHLVSLGYSWRDRSLAHLLLGNREKLESLTVVTRKNEVPDLLRQFCEGAPKIFRLISNEALTSSGPKCGDISGGGASVGEVGRRCISPDTFMWALTTRVLDRLAKEGVAVQPIARHLILGNLFHDLGAKSALPLSRTALPTRVRTEILLHLAKGKGFVNTSGAQASPRIHAYFQQLRGVGGAKVTAQNFLGLLKVEKNIVRSHHPEARDTFFTPRENTKDLIIDLARAIAKPIVRRRPRVEVPEFGSGGGISTKVVSTEEFLRQQIGIILGSSDIEVTGPPDRSLDWLFSCPQYIPSYGRFGELIRTILRSPWTHLLAVSESALWLHFDWVQECMRPAANSIAGSGKQLLFLLPSQDGLEEWKLWGEYTNGKSPLSDIDVTAAYIPWWRHNRHLILAINAVSGQEFSINQAIYFTRRYKSPVIAPVYLADERDCIKLFRTFLSYLLRALKRDPTDTALLKKVDPLIPAVLRSMKEETAPIHEISQQLEIYRR